MERNSNKTPPKANNFRAKDMSESSTSTSRLLETIQTNLSERRAAQL